MSEFSELVKRFDNIRSYVRDFYIYGFKTREDYQTKSGRTYDNERRRIESWFSDYIHRTYNSEGRKSVAITLDSSRICVNPLYSAWKSKSFTNNDIMLHFFILDLLQDGEPRSADEMTYEIQMNYQVLFDSQTVRKKLVEYHKTGLLSLQKEGRQNLYTVNPSISEEIPEELPNLLDSIQLFQGIAPFGFVGSTILDNQQTDNSLFRLKHDFLVHTLEDEVLLTVLSAMNEHRFVTITIKACKSSALRELTGTPMKILVSTQTGRRYLCIHNQSSKRFYPSRLDSIQAVAIGGVNQEYAALAKAFNQNRLYCWGVSFGRNRNPETVSLTVTLNEKTELHIVNRLEREGRQGQVTRLEPGIYLYEGEFWDANELLPWIKTFTGRIVSFQCSNQAVEDTFYQDMKRMSGLYLTNQEEGETNGIIF